jgi:hypothetical protein
MTPSDLARMVHQELSPLLPELSAELNHNLLEVGEGSIILSGQSPKAIEPYQKAETIRVQPEQTALVLAKVSNIIEKLETHSNWRIVVERKKSHQPGILELMYTFYRVQMNI